ncbi:26S proteasome non-ATPase regulatory subunit 4, partial [Tanacetum coccineum]
MYKRIVIFAGGPVYWFKHDLIEIGMKFKEKGVAVDVINLGDKDGPRAGVCEDWRDVFKDNIIPRRKSLILSRIRWEQCCSSNSFESIIARQKVQIDALTQENEKLKRELEFFRTESLKFGRKTRSAEMKGFEKLQADVYANNDIDYLIDMKMQQYS